MRRISMGPNPSKWIAFLLTMKVMVADMVPIVLKRLAAPSAPVCVHRWLTPMLAVLTPHAVTGATTKIRPIQSSEYPARAALGQEFQWIFESHPNRAETFEIRGELPPGVRWIEQSFAGVSALVGRPSASGIFVVHIIGWQKSGPAGDKTDPYPLVIEVTQDPVFSPPPSITKPPLSGDFLVGVSMTLEVTASGADLQYQWIKDRRDIPGETGPQLVIPNLALNDGGEYRVRVANGTGATLSEPAIVRVVATGWEGWRAKHWPTGGEDSNPKADPDGDQLPNLVEYALGLDPKSISPWPIRFRQAGEEIIVTFASAHPPSDVRMSVQCSETLIEWEFLEQISTSNSITAKSKPGFPFLRLSVDFARD